MELLTHRPSPPLGECVALLWYAAGPAAPGPRRERVLPDGCVELVIPLREEALRVYDGEGACRSFSGPLVSGPQERYFVVDPSQQAGLLGVHFRPGGARALLGAPTDELRGACCPLEALWGRAAGELQERLRETASPQARFLILEQCFRARAAGATESHPAVRFALRRFARGRESVGEVTERTGLSARRFIRLFSEQVGLTPKRYCRIRRFQAALRRIRPGEPVDWSDLALGCGYYDQPHFIRDFRAFSGLTPTGYREVRGENPNHVPLGA